MLTALFAAFGLLILASPVHEQANPLYKQLCSRGIVVDGRTLARLPGPTVPDGLDASSQQAALRSIPMRLPFSHFVRDSIVAPYAMSIGKLSQTQAGIRIRTLDIWFIAYGDLDAIGANRQWLDDFLHRVQGGVRLLSPEELQQRGIHLPVELAGRASYKHVVCTLLERVRLEVTSYVVFSQTAESIVLAGTIDPRFIGDRQFPNRWRPIEIRAGRKQLGSAAAYSASAGYWKATQLKAPAGAILLEYHSVFEQPAGWFGGHDLLRSKLPLAVQSQVRNFRRKLKKAAG